MTELMTEAEAAKELRLHPKTLARMRRDEQGPPHITIGDGERPRIRYRRADVTAWVKERAQAS